MKTLRSTIKDVALKAGVSISVVSYVLNNTPGKTVTAETRQRILDAAKELDYSPDSIARGMRMKRSGAVGLVSFWKVTDAVFVQILEGVTRIAGINGYNLVLCGLEPGQREFEYAELFKRRNIDGVILVSPPEGDLHGFVEERHIEVIKKYKIPSVIINGYTEAEGINYIYVDYYSSAYIAVKYLIGLGHRKLAYILPDERQVNHQRSFERLKGYKDALKDEEIQIESESIYRFENLDSVIDGIVSGNGPTGIVISKSDFGYAFLKAAYNKGIKIPEQVSLIAANTEPYTPYLFPSLTSVQIPLREMGECSVEVLLDNIEGKMGSLKLKLTNEIKERDSCRRVI